MFDTLIHMAGILAEKMPEKPAVIYKKESLTYKQLYAKALGISSRLKNLDILPGDRVCFSAVSKPEMVAVYLGIHVCGGIAVFLDKGSTPAHMMEIYQSSGAKILLTDKPMKDYGTGCRIESLRGIYAEAEADADGEIAERNPEDIAEILFTTGTTGKPKGAMLSFRAVYHILMNTKNGCEYNEHTIMLLPLPLNHSFALRVLRAVLYAGGTVVLQNGFTFAKEAENNILSFDCNSIAFVPASYEVLKSQMQDAFRNIMSRLSIIEVSAGSLSIAQRRDLVGQLPRVKIMNVWGSSESGGAIFCDVNEVSKDERTIGSLGRAIDGVEVCFLSLAAPFDDPEQMKENFDQWKIEGDAAHPGRMAIKGNMCMSGYWDDPDKTAETLIGDWLITGDMAYSDAESNIFMLGRADDIINVGGEKVSPIEMENIAGQYEHIRDCACIGAADDLLGQVPVLFVVTGNNYDEVEFQKWLAGVMERTKIPRKIITVNEIPKNRMKKIDRKALHELMENRGALELMNPVIGAILSRRSIRKFTSQDVPRDMLDLILKCGYNAPSGHNMQSWLFTVLTQEADIQKLKETASETAKQNNVIMYGFENPKVMILISNDSRNPYGCQDASCAAENIMIAAQSFGLGSVWLNMLMKLRNEFPVKKTLDSFGIPENHTIWASIALGWPVTEGIRLQKKTDVVKYI